MCCFHSPQHETVSLHDPASDMPVKYPLCPHDAAWATSIPIRLTHAERKSMRLLSAVIKTTQYTDLVDTPQSDPKRLHAQISEIFSICMSLVVGTTDIREAIALTQDPSSIKSHEGRIRGLIECLRRYKILNPEKFRTDYIKCVYLLQDSQLASVRDGLNDLSLIADLHTVGAFCRAKGLEGLLRETALPLCITPVPRISDLNALNRALRYKNAVVRKVTEKYLNRASEAEIELAMFSIADMHQFTVQHTMPIDRMLRLIKTHFSPFRIERAEFDLGISASHSSQSRLTHSHAQQFLFVVQSLTLWRNLLDRFHDIWATAEREMLDPSNGYSLEDSGQGKQRIQRRCAKTFAAIQSILESTIEEVKTARYEGDDAAGAGQWIGSRKIHIGDAQVPNGMVFIDKYTNVSRILSPILRVFERIAETDEFTREFVRIGYGSSEHLTKVILADFVRHGFDGSGGDTWDDAGSCIDGRLTSTWNWCNSIAKKPFYPAFQLAGFQSFDGDLEE